MPPYWFHLQHLFHKTCTTLLSASPYYPPIMRSTPEIRYNMIHPQEDCSSLAETLPVSTPKMASTATSSSRRRNRVRFELGASQSYESANSSMEDCADCWYKAQDYATFKADSIQQGKDIRRKEREYGPEFATYEIVLERVLEVCSMAEAEDELNIHQVMDADEREIFHQCIAADMTRVGLEKNIASGLNRDKSYRRKDLLRAVKEVERDAYTSASQKPLTLALACQEVTRPSRLFAIMMAQAQAEAQD